MTVDRPVVVFSAGDRRRRRDSEKNMKSKHESKGSMSGPHPAEACAPAAARTSSLAGSEVASAK